jgi:hypothetical protein
LPRKAHRLSELTSFSEMAESVPCQAPPFGGLMAQDGGVMLVTTSIPPPRPAKVDMEGREAAKRACGRHLEDLRRAYEEPPAAVVVSSRGLPKFVAPILEQSYRTSPAALCADLVK